MADDVTKVAEDVAVDEGNGGKKGDGKQDGLSKHLRPRYIVPLVVLVIGTIMPRRVPAATTSGSPSASFMTRSTTHN